MRATNGLEEFSFIYVTSMVIIGCLGYFFFAKAFHSSNSTNAIINTEKKAVNIKSKTLHVSVEEEQKATVEILTAEKAVQIIESRKLLKEPGKYRVKVTSVVPFVRKDGTELSIINYAAMTPSQLLQAKELYNEGKYEEATNLYLASSQRIGKDYQPTKEEFVNIDIDWVPTKTDPSIKMLLVINCTKIKVVYAPNVNFSNHIEEEPSFPTKTYKVDGLFKNQINETDKINLDLISTDNIAQLFIPLDIERKARVLSIFLQIKHNNTFIDNLFESYSILFNFEFKYDDYDEGFEFFKASLISNQINRILIIIFLESVKTYLPEFCRLSAILSAVNGDNYARDSYLSLANDAWEKNKKLDEFLYGFILIKTKADLFIYENNYSEAAKICENTWDYLEMVVNEKIGWLKYQIALTLIKISNYTEINFDVNILIEQLERLESDAELENPFSPAQRPS